MRTPSGTGAPGPRSTTRWKLWTEGTIGSPDESTRVPVSVEFQPIHAVSNPGRTFVAQVTVTY